MLAQSLPSTVIGEQPIKKLTLRRIKEKSKKFLLWGMITMFTNVGKGMIRGVRSPQLSSLQASLFSIRDKDLDCKFAGLEILLESAFLW